MGRLAGFRYRTIAKKLTKFGFTLQRTCKGSHEIWHCSDQNISTTVPRHRGDMPEGTLRAILTPAKIEPEDFLQK